MPVFGKGRVGRAVKKNADSDPFETQLTRGERSKRKYSKRFGYGIRDSTLSEVEREFWYSLRRLIMKTHIRTKQPVVVLDWGCGTGRAITELAQIFPFVKAYGISQDSYTQWKKNDKVKFIQEDAENSLRYFRDKGVDVIFSKMALYHLWSSGLMEEYLKKLCNKLKIDGILLMENNERYNALMDKMKYAGYSTKIITTELGTKRAIMITRTR